MSKENWRPAGLLLLGLMLLAAWLRWPGLFANTFHADEALFASWARLIAVWRDPLLQSQTVDKPPLLFYTQAAFYPLLGPVDWAARLPNFIAGLLLVPLTGRLAWLLYRQVEVAVLAAAIVALSPLAVQFSPTAFTDPLLTCLLISTLVAAISGQKPGQSAFWSGLLFGLAAATKYQAWLFLPLVVALAGWRRWPRPAWARFLAGLLLVLLVLLVWEMAHAGRPALWSNQLASFGGLRLAWSWELWPRLVAWGQLWNYALAWPVTGLFLIVTPLFWLWSVRQSSDGRDRSSAMVDQLLLLFALAYVLTHWFLAIPVWDRYLLPFLPLVALLAARAMAWLAAGIRVMSQRIGVTRHDVSIWIVGLLLMAIMAGAALQARRGALPVGGQPEADGGAAEVAAWLAGAPYGTVLYDHWYSWHWRYYLFDGTVYLSWFPHPAVLVEDLQAFGGRPESRYLVLPDRTEAQVVTRVLTAAGFDLQPVMTTSDSSTRSGMQLYRLRARPPIEEIREGG